MILLYDDCFAINRERLNEFCEGIKKLQKEISWELKWSPSLTVHLIDDELLGLMKDAGCEVIGYGFESFSKKILDSMNKPISPQMIDNAFKRTLNAKIGVAANFIFGDINETKETAKETLDYWKKNARGQINLFIVDPYPGSKIYDYCINKGIIKDKLYFIKNQMGHMFDTHLNISSMSNREFNKLKRELIYAELKYGATGKNSVLKGNVLKVNCPFCKTHQIYKNVKSDGFMNYDFLVMCRNCKMRFFARSNLKQFIYNFYPIAKPIHNSYLKIKKFINLGFLRK